MSGEDSFDPKNWARPAPGRSELPEAWRDIVNTPAEQSPAPVSDVTIQQRSGARITALLPFILSIAVLASGGVAAWMMRSPPETLDTMASLAAQQSQTDPSLISSRSLVLARAADLVDALRASGLSPQDAAAANTAALTVLGATPGEIHATLNLINGPDGVKLDRLEASFADGSGAIVSAAADGGFAATRVAAELSSQIQVVSGELDSTSFYSSAVAAGVIDSLIPDFINAFSFDFDLQQEVNPGDTFEVAYEQTVNARGEPVGQPALLFASLVTPAKRRALYRYTPAGEEAGWFDGNGASTVRSLMRTPVDGARISSKFGYRIHPIYGYSKLHGGTDFAAPQGTPIYASGNAVAEFVGPKGCNGNFIRLHHDNGWYTHYLHLVRFNEGITNGTRVTQGQVIGFVGTTGCSTGPHLHYEVVVGGEKVDPLSIKTEAGRKGLEGAALAAFIQRRDRVDVARARQAQ